MFASLRSAEAAAALSGEESDEKLFAFPTVAVDPAIVLPLPTKQQWQLETARDPDLKRIMDAAAAGHDHISKADFSDKGYFEPWNKKQFTIEDGIVWFYEEPFRARHHELRVKVVPTRLRRVVISACHVSPMAGHSGIKRTHQRLAARFWWPSLNRDVHQAVSSCAHCRLSNIASHEAQQTLHTLSSDVPFDVIFLDLWVPGDVPDKTGAKKALTFIDCMTGFADGAPMPDMINAETVAMAAFSKFFIPFGLPRLILVDQEGVFKGVFKQLFELLGIPVEPVSPENHKWIRNERFHRYLNKVERINTADVQSFHQWFQGFMFALYAWNAGPIDGTDLSRSYVAIGREFPFPINLSHAVARDSASEGEQAIDHCDAASPLLFKQRQLLSILNDER